MPAFTLSKKIFITFFLIAMGTAFFFSCLNSYDRTNFSPEQTSHHYKGNDENQRYGEEFSYPMSYSEVIEVMHVHAFLIPLIIFVMSRILSMTGTGEGIKITVYVSAFIGTIMNLSGPYLIIYSSEIFTISLIASYIILGTCFIAFISLPIGKMWSRKPVEETDYWL
ncbi:MAG: hypothetical protein ACYST3_03125 [Planctomycetota bacterium]|jgi:hypothetical protein